MVTRDTITCTAVCCAISAMSVTTRISADEGPTNPNYTPLAPQDYGPESQPGNELADIVFLIDGSGSMDNGGFELQKEGIKNCIVGPDAFIPHDENGALCVAGLEGNQENIT